MAGSRRRVSRTAIRPECVRSRNELRLRAQFRIGMEARFQPAGALFLGARYDTASSSVRSLHGPAMKLRR
jgi:hypothetical protein